MSSNVDRLTNGLQKKERKKERKKKKYNHTVPYNIIIEKEDMCVIFLRGPNKSKKKKKALCYLTR